MTVTLDQLNAMSRDDFVAALGSIFEHAPWVAQDAASKRPFASVVDLHRAMIAVVEAASADTRCSVVGEGGAGNSQRAYGSRRAGRIS